MGPLPKGPLGVKNILALINIFSKHVRLYAIRRATTDIILKKVLDDYVPKHGSIKQILTDNGTQFSSTKWTKQLQVVGIKAIFTTTYHPENNPIERTNREIGRMLQTRVVQLAARDAINCGPRKVLRKSYIFFKCYHCKKRCYKRKTQNA